MLKQDFLRANSNLRNAERWEYTALLCMSVGALLTCVGGFFAKHAGDFRIWFLAALFATVVIVQFGSEPFHNQLKNNSKRLWPLFWNSVGVLFLVAGFSQYFSFRLNGIDFSIFDWMISFQNLQGLLTSPLCNCNHFAVHPSFVLLPFVPLHAVFSSPVWLIAAHALAILSALFPLRRLCSHFYPNNSLIHVALLSCFVASGWVGSIANYGFHMEVFYLPFLLWFAAGWVEQKKPIWIVAALAAFAVKEDAPLYLAAFAFGSFIFENRKKEALGLFFSSVGMLFVLTRIVQPYFRDLSGQGNPEYFTFWKQWGNTPPEVVWGVLRSPVQAFLSVASSKWYVLYGSLLFLPFLSGPTLVAALPSLGLLGLSSSPALHTFGLYYAAPLVPFVLWGFLQATAHYAWARKLVFPALLLFAVSKGSSLKVEKPKFALARAAHSAQNFLAANAKNQPICVQTALFPHLGYQGDLRPLNAPCLALHESFVVIAKNENPYPAQKQDLEELENSPSMHLVLEEVGLGIYKRKL